MPRKPTFKSVWTKETVEQVLKEHLEFEGPTLMDYLYLCIRSRTFKHIWSQHSYLLKQRARKFSPEYTWNHHHFSGLLFTGIYGQPRINLLTAFLKHELKNFK